MTILLFPGRHLLHTRFQQNYIQQILAAPPSQLPIAYGSVVPVSGSIQQIVFAITSANQQHSRYNPLPLYTRAIGVDRFAQSVKQDRKLAYRIIPIPHYQPTSRFAEIIIKTIAEASEGELQLSAQNCIVLCSTPQLITQFQKLGFAILPAERGYEPPVETPIELISALTEAGGAWTENSRLRCQLSTSTVAFWSAYPGVPRRIRRMWSEPLLTDSGGLTEARDYDVYASRMSHRDVIAIKYQDIKTAIRPGRIVDEGCGDGALLARVAQDFPDSDLIGIEITAEFIARCLERQRAGDFGGAFVHFHQRNILTPVFEANSIDTTLCNSTIHELFSYGEGTATIQQYLTLKYEQLVSQGRLIIRDVIGPSAKEQLVYLWLNRENGANDPPVPATVPGKQLTEILARQSTLGRFRQFAQDFLAEERLSGRRSLDSKVQCQLVEQAGRIYARVRLKDAAEFIAKMDYIDNWRSEMHEEFAFWSFQEWKDAVATAGFQVQENPNQSDAGSRAYLNPWLVENRYSGKVALYRCEDGERFIPLQFPPSNIVLVAVKP